MLNAINVLAGTQIRDYNFVKYFLYLDCDGFSFFNFHISMVDIDSIYSE